MAIRIDGTNTTANPGITGADADTGLQFGTNELKLVTGGTEAVKIDSNQKLTASQGILFGTDTADANTLDDYEEGTWTPTATASSGTITSYVSGGRYTKIGRLVHLSFYVNITNVGTANGSYLNVTNAPFASANTWTQVGTCREQSVNGFLINLNFAGNGTTIQFTRYDNAGTIVASGNYACTISYHI